jgi:UDP-3-O-[3-hydroxymyristoyl] glucosamine N-acyltransferase
VGIETGETNMNCFFVLDIHPAGSIRYLASSNHAMALTSDIRHARPFTKAQASEICAMSGGLTIVSMAQAKAEALMAETEDALNEMANDHVLM